MRCWCNRSTLLAGSLSLLLLGGCESVPKPATAPLPQADAPLRKVSAQELAALLHARAEATKSARGLFQAKIKGPGLLLPARVDGTVFYQRPDAMRVRGFSFFGGELFELVLNGDRYRLALPTEGKELKGQASDLEQVAKFGRPVQLSLLAVHGALGLTTIAPTDQLTLVEEGDRYRLEAAAAVGSELEGIVRRMWFDRRSLLMVQEEWRSASGQVEATMRYEDFRPDVDVESGEGAGEAAASADATGAPAGEVQPVKPEPRPASVGIATPTMRPHRIVMEDGRGRGSVQLTMQELTANVPVTPGDLGTI